MIEPLHLSVEIPDGTEIDWGEITRWNPPHRLGYLWHINRDRDAATDVDLTFVAIDEGRTRLGSPDPRLRRGCRPLIGRSIDHEVTITGQEA